MMGNKRIGLLYMVLFLAFLGAMSVLALRNALGPMRTAVAQDEPVMDRIDGVEAAFDENLPQKSEWIAFHGLIQRMLLKHEVGNFAVLKDQAGMLHRPYVPVETDLLLEYADNLEGLYHHAEEGGAAFLYVEAPSDIIDGKTAFGPGLEDQYSGDISEFLTYAEAAGVPLLDLRPHLRDREVESIFYRTDHHWSVETAFQAMTLLVKELNQRYSLDLDPAGRIRNPENYEAVVYPQSFLGSVGIRTGRYYAGKDDFVVYEPAFDTSLAYTHYQDGELTREANGDFFSAFMDETLLQDPSYNNKYNAFLFNEYGEHRILNHLAENELKCLVISDSFARPLTPYVSLCFRETAFIDPNEGRYKDSFTAYIDAFQPDVVVVLFNGRGVYVPVPY